MSSDPKERRHRRTWRHHESIALMASANFDAVPSLAEAMGLETAVARQTMSDAERVMPFRGQTMNEAQRLTVVRLLAKGWRAESMFRKNVPMYFDRPSVGLPKPHVIHIRRDGSVHNGYPTRSNPH